MAEPVTTATETPATNGAAAEPMGLLDALEALPDVPEEATGAETPEAKDKPAPEAKTPKVEAKPEPEAKSDPESKLDIDEALFTDEALASPDGVARAAEVVKVAAEATKERNQLLDRYNMRIKRKDEKVKRELEQGNAKLAADRQALEQEFSPIRQAARDVSAELRILDPRSGASAIERFAALGRLNGGMDGRELYEHWTLGIAADGKVPAPSRSEAQLQQRIDQLEGALRQRFEGEETAAGQAQIAQLRQGVAGQLAEISTMAQDAEKYPAIAARVAAADDDGETLAEVTEWVKRAMVKAHESGKPLDKATAIGRVEARLARLSGGTPAPAAQAAESGNSSSPGSPARGAGKGTTVLPTSADRSTGIVRTPKTERERDAENLRDPRFLDMLPFLKP